jgi:hypothetical protein
LEIAEFKDGFDKKRYKLDFKNGLQAFAGQSDKFQSYAEASKITHSSGRMLAATTQSYYVFVMLRLFETVRVITPLLMNYFKTNYYIGREKEFAEFQDAVKRDMASLEKNDKVILAKYPAKN